MERYKLLKVINNEKEYERQKDIKKEKKFSSIIKKSFRNEELKVKEVIKD